MKICRVAFAYPSEELPGGGLTPYYLSRYIDEPTLYVTREVRGKKREVPSHVVLKEVSFKDEATPHNLREVLHTEQRESIVQGILTHLKVMKTMRGIKFFLKSIPALIAFRPDIVASHENRSILHGVFAKYLLGSKFILHLHNNSEVEVIRNLWLLKFLVQRADLIFCLSQTMGKELESVVPSVAERIRYTSTGVDPALFSNTEVDRKNQLIAIGSFKRTKGYRYLLDAMPQVFSQHPEYNLVIVGDGADRGEMEKQIDRLGISDRVQLAGIVSRQRVVELLNESKVFVMSSLNEGLPKVLLEALACGTPAVVTTGCNADDLIEGRGLLVETRNSQALAEAIAKLVEDKELWRRCSINAPTIGDEYNWENVARKVYDRYRANLQ